MKLITDSAPPQLFGNEVPKDTLLIPTSEDKPIKVYYHSNENVTYITFEELIEATTPIDITLPLSDQEWKEFCDKFYGE